MGDGLQLGASSLSEALLRDLRAVDVRSAKVSLGQQAAVELADQRRAIVHVLLEGKATITVGSEPPAILHAGDAALLYYGDGHRIGVPGAEASPLAFDYEAPVPEEPPAYAFGDGDTTALILTCSMQLGYRSPALYASRTILWTMSADAAESEQSAPPAALAGLLSTLQGPGAQAIAAVTAELYLFHALRNIYRVLWRDRSTAVGSPDTRRVTHALQAINSHLDQPWTVAELARLVGMSRSGFAALFTAEVGVAPLTYLTNARMTRAARLLELGMRPMTEVARRVGYPLQASFSRAFSAFHGVSPSCFVKKGRAG